MYAWIVLWALWMATIVLLNAASMRRRSRRGGARYRRQTASDSWSGGFPAGDLFGGSSHYGTSSWGSDCGSSWGSADAGSSWGGSDGGSSSSSC